MIERNGHEPPIVGKVCQGLVAIELRHAGELIEPANVVFLKFDGHWHRLYFDFATIFWRASEAGPIEFEADELGSACRAVDIGGLFGLRGRVLLALSYDEISGGSAVRLEFDGNRAIAFRCIDDRTTYDADI